MKSMKRYLPFSIRAFVTGAALLASACATQVTPQNQATIRTFAVPVAEQALPNFTLVPGDEIEIKFPDRSDLNETTHVRPDGYIDLAIVGAVRAYGRTPEDLSSTIKDAYRALGTGDAKQSDVKYLLAIGDELEIKLPFHTGFDQITKIRPDGRISLALAGTIQAQGMTPEALEAELEKRYSQHIRKPSVSVSVRSFSTTRVSVDGRSAFSSVADLRPVVQLKTLIPRQIFIGGEVAHPGVITHRHTLTALQAIVEAGGLKSAAAGSNAAILRRTSEGLKLIPINASTLDTVSVSVPNDIVLEPFDILVVPKTPLAATAAAIDQVFNLLPPLRNSSFSMIYQFDKGNTTAVTASP